MDVIPVIDLQAGAVVRATRGDRASYRAIETPLSASPDPVLVVRGFLRVHPFKTLYVADLDAIQGGSVQEKALRRLHEEFPRIAIWADCGIRDRVTLDAFASIAVGRPVVGSETLEDLSVLDSGDAILSLDFKDGVFAGDAELLANPPLWPSTVIVMSLAHVGTALGPDFARVEALVPKKTGGRIYAAGGIRDAADLSRLKRAGAAGALVSSALHAGAIDAAALEALTSDPSFGSKVLS